MRVVATAQPAPAGGPPRKPRAAAPPTAARVAVFDLVALRRDVTMPTVDLAGAAGERTLRRGLRGMVIGLSAPTPGGPPAWALVEVIRPICRVAVGVDDVDVLSRSGWAAEPAASVGPVPGAKP